MTFFRSIGCLPFAFRIPRERLLENPHDLEAGPLSVFAEVPLLPIVVLIGCRDPTVQDNPPALLCTPVSLYQLNHSGFDTL